MMQGWLHPVTGHWMDVFREASRKHNTLDIILVTIQFMFRESGEVLCFPTSLSREY